MDRGGTARRPTLGAVGSWLPFALCLVLTAAATALVALSEARAERARFTSAVMDAREHIEVRMSSYVALLRGAAALLSRDQPLSPAEFRVAVELLRLPLHYPGTLGLGYSQRFGAVSAAQATERAHREGWTEVTVWPDTPRSEVHAIVLLEPLDARNRAALGFDMSTEAVRREAMDRARDEGEAALSGKVTLVQEIGTEKQAGFLLYMPVYEGGAIPATVEERRAMLKGYLYAPLRAGDLLEGIFSHERRTVGLELYDDDDMRPEELLYRFGPAADGARELRDEHLQVAGRSWSARFVRRASTPRIPRAVTVMLLGTLLSGFVFLVTRTREEARARELRAEASAITSRQVLRFTELFVGILGHDLRVPLNVISLGAQVLLKRQPDDASREVLNRIVSSSRRMGRMIDQILDLTRARLGGGIAVVPAPTDLGAIARDVVDELSKGTPGCELALEATGDLRGTWDPDRLAQVFSNLVGNALQHSHGAKVSVTLSGLDPERVVARVHNAGVIPAALLPVLFEPFHRADAPRAGPGLGLGLFITRTVVDAHGGTLEVDSATDRGTTFTVTLPRQPPVTAS